jgi:hypothetical protein
MKKIVLQGLGTGLVTASVAWLGDLTIAHRVSTFPDLVSLFVLVLLTAIVFAKVERTQRARVATAFGLASGTVIGAATALRGAVRWTTPDASMMAIGFITALVLVVGVTHIVSFLARPRAASVTAGH